MNTPSPTTPVAELRCPLCGQANQRAVACGASFDHPCWCTTVQFSANTLARIAPDQRGKACICQSCATTQAPKDGA
jgi:hypothetical protein